MSLRKILQICHGYDPPFLEVGNQYAHIFEADECEVTTLYLSGENSLEVEQATSASKVLFFELDSESLKGLKYGVVKKLRNLLKTGQYDMIICHRYKAMYLTGLASLGLPKFVWVGVVHDFKVFASLSRRSFVRVFGAGLNVLGVSQAIRDDIVKCCPVLKGRVFSQPNGIDVESLQARQFSRHEARQRLGLDAEAFVFGTAGRLHPVKDQQTLLRAFAQKHDSLGDAMVVIMGSGKLSDSLKKLARELGIEDKVKFLGQIPDGPMYFKAFDVFILPSVKEPFGMVLIEAMVAGVPIVSSRTGGTAEVVGDAGVLFPPGNVDDLAEKMANSRNWSPDVQNSYVEKAYVHLNRHFSLHAFRTRFKGFPFYPADT